jgi:hypothetical protein
MEWLPVLPTLKSMEEKRINHPKKNPDDGRGVNLLD